MLLIVSVELETLYSQACHIQLKVIYKFILKMVKRGTTVQSGPDFPIG